MLFTILKTIRAVLWSFLGIRKSAEFQKDIRALTPLQIMVVGIGLCFVFVFSLIALVHFLVKV